MCIHLIKLVFEKGGHQSKQCEIIIWSLETIFGAKSKSLREAVSSSRVMEGKSCVGETFSWHYNSKVEEMKI